MRWTVPAFAWGVLLCAATQAAIHAINTPAIAALKYKDFIAGLRVSGMIMQKKSATKGHPVQSSLSDFGFEMQDSSNFTIPRGPLFAATYLRTVARASITADPDDIPL